MIKLKGRVLRRGLPGWEDARRDYHLAINYDELEPEVIVFCQDVEDVVCAVQWARQQGLPLRVRSGRHSYEAYSLVKGGIVIDVSELDTVRVDPETGIATVGAGLATLALFEKLWDSGLTVPGATGPTVGIAGCTLGGGFGVTSRKFGLSCDNLLEVELVTADGEIVRANSVENADLFWACQGGGGGNFGIATSFTFQAHPVGFVVAFNISWRWEAFQPIVDTWQRWAPDTEDGLATFLRLSSDGVITLLGQYTAEIGELGRIQSLLTPLLSAAPPSAVSIQTVPFIMAARSFAGVDPIRPQWLVHIHNDQEMLKSTSAFAYETFSESGLATLKRNLETAPSFPGTQSRPCMVQLLGGGGAPARIAQDATAVFHRQAKFILQYDGFWTAPQDAAQVAEWVRNFRTSMLPYTRGAYVNYVDANLTDWLCEYYGDNAKRLVDVKRKYDPDNVFNFPQSIPLTL